MDYKMAGACDASGLQADRYCEDVRAHTIRGDDLYGVVSRSQAKLLDLTRQKYRCIRAIRNSEATILSIDHYRRRVTEAFSVDGQSLPSIKSYRYNRGSLNGAQLVGAPAVSRELNNAARVGGEVVHNHRRHSAVKRPPFIASGR